MVPEFRTTSHVLNTQRKYSFSAHQSVLHGDNPNELIEYVYTT